MKLRLIRKDWKIREVLSQKFEKPHTTTFSITREKKEHFGYHWRRIVLSLQFPPPFWCVVLLVRLFWSMMLLLHSFAFMFNNGGLVHCTESQGGKPKRKTEAAFLLFYRLAGVADFRGAWQCELYWRRRWRCEWKRNIEKLVDPRTSLLLTCELADFFLKTSSKLREKVFIPRKVQECNCRLSSERRARKPTFLCSLCATRMTWLL